MNRTIFKAIFLLLVLTFVQAQAQDTGKTSVIKPSELLSLENASRILGMDLQIDEKYFDKQGKQPVYLHPTV